MHRMYKESKLESQYGKDLISDLASPLLIEDPTLTGEESKILFQIKERDNFKSIREKIKKEQT